MSKRVARANASAARAVPLKPGAAAKLEELGQAMANLVRQGKRVYLVLNIPTSPQFDPRGMIRRSISPPGYTVDIPSPTRPQIDAAVDSIASKLREIAQASGATVIDPVEQLCNAQLCPAVTSTGEPMYRDPRHLRPSYVRMHADFLDRTILESGAM